MSLVRYHSSNYETYLEFEEIDEEVNEEDEAADRWHERSEEKRQPKYSLFET